MLHSIQLTPAATMAAVRTALARAPAGEVALEWPLGAPCALASAPDMEELLAACDELGKDVVIVGGDESLRAHAVAAGFAAATSLAEWETSKQRAVRGTSFGRRVRAQPAVPPPPALVKSPLEEDPHLFDLEGDDPPDYVLKLRRSDEQQRDFPARTLGPVPTIPLRGRHSPTHAEERRREAAEAVAQERAQQLYEEHIIATIRTTGLPFEQQSAAQADGCSAPDTEPVSQPTADPPSANA